MTSTNDELAFNAALAQRVRSIREAKGWTAEEMAVALGVPAERYRKYEGRSPIPQYLVPRVALISGRSVEWVLTGKDPKIFAATMRP
jgi:transcriptional regulator with XRE-family HTH domain